MLSLKPARSLVEGISDLPREFALALKRWSVSRYSSSDHVSCKDERSREEDKLVSYPKDAKGEE